MNAIKKTVLKLQLQLIPHVDLHLLTVRDQGLALLIGKFKCGEKATEKLNSTN